MVQQQETSGRAEKKAIRRPGEAPRTGKRNLSGIIQYGELLFISGIGAHEGGNIRVQTKRVMDDIRTALELAGSDCNKMLKATVFLTHIRDYEGMNEVYREYFAADPPARSCVVVSCLPGRGDELVEIECIAYV